MYVPNLRPAGDMSFLKYAKGIMKKGKMLEITVGGSELCFRDTLRERKKE
jgi:hypothetical protein